MCAQLVKVKAKVTSDTKECDYRELQEISKLVRDMVNEEAEFAPVTYDDELERRKRRGIEAIGALLLRQCDQYVWGLLMSLAQERELDSHDWALYALLVDQAARYARLPKDTRERWTAEVMAKDYSVREPDKLVIEARMVIESEADVLDFERRAALRAAQAREQLAAKAQPVAA